jgi:small subunit ribosomal protein S21
MEVRVRNNDVSKAFRTLKKKLQKDGLFRELRLRKYFEKPSAKRARKKKEGIRRVAKEQRLKLKRGE